MGELIGFRTTSKVSRDDRLGIGGEVVEFPLQPMAARAMWQRMDFELAQVLGAALDARKISDGSCWVLTRVKGSWSYVFLIDSVDALFSVMTADDFQAMRPELEQWAGEVFCWLWQGAAGRAG